MNRHIHSGLCVFALLFAGVAEAQMPQDKPAPLPPVERFLELTSRDEATARAAFEAIGSAWRNRDAAMLVDLARLTPLEPRRKLLALLERKTGRKFGDAASGKTWDAWRRWVWSLPYDPHPDYARFKGLLYSFVDPKMRKFFPPGAPSLIRLDEIQWGGVKVNGIPPLDHPPHIPVRDAAYLADRDVVFGIEINGEARAYPKRILAWHELVRDRVASLEFTIVYCTLCGTVIPYKSEVGGKLRVLGTSGLLYRSNKLMFDEETSSLWSTLEARPVVGSLAGSGLRLEAQSVVTTTWAEWRAEHPETTVLSLETGYQRDYGEGVAYRNYFATDDLMFDVAVKDNDRRLKNKDEVLVMRLGPPDASEKDLVPAAIAADFLRKNPLYQTEIAGRKLLIVTSGAGANRVYEVEGMRFARRLDDRRLEDSTAGIWIATEQALVSENSAGRHFPRLPAQRAFWFGWYAQFPQTVLIK